MASNRKIILFSGRFDRPHTGHIITLARLGCEYDLVKIVVLNYSEQHYALAYRLAILEEACKMLKGNYEVSVNNTHFGKITRNEIRQFEPFTVYGSGNQAVLFHVEQLGYPVRYIERAYDFQAVDDRRFQEIRKVLQKG